jgi:hypothetical protein
MSPEGRHRAALELGLGSPEQARAVATALLADDPGAIACEARGATLVVRASSPSMMGLLRTLDDVVACVRASGG